MNMKVIADMASNELRSGIAKERLLFALVLLCEWYVAFRQKVSELRHAYEEAGAPGRIHQNGLLPGKEIAAFPGPK
jgi:hypothetical protein